MLNFINGLRSLILALLCISGGILYSQTSTAPQQGDIRLKLGLPYINSISLHPANTSRKSQTGWVGLEGGFEYQYADRSFIALEYSLNGTAEFLGLMDRAGDIDHLVSQSLNLTDNQNLYPFSIGYGLSFAINRWLVIRKFVPDYFSESEILENKASRNLGLITNFYYQVNSTFNIGLIYRAYLFKFNPDTPLDYEHVATLDFMWRFCL